MDMLAYDKLVRITGALERAERRAGNMVSLSDYNSLSDQYNTLVQKYNNLYYKHEALKKTTDDFETWGDKLAELVKSVRGERNAARQECDQARADLKASRRKETELSAAVTKKTREYDELYTKGKAWADMWRGRAEAAEKELAALKASMQQFGTKAG